MAGVPSDGWEMHDAFLQRAHEVPDDDAPRLVYADWLAERGDAAWTAYAEFIRNQLEAATLKNRSKNRQARLDARQQELLAAHARVWLGPWAAGSAHWVYQRGLPERLCAWANGAWIGKRLGADGGFDDRVVFSENGRLKLDYGDINWPGMYPTVYGVYRLRFTFAQVDLAIELWQVAKRTIHYKGKFTGGGLGVELDEPYPSPTREPQRHVQLRLKAPAAGNGG